MKIPKEFEDVFHGVELTEGEIRTLTWITGWEHRTVENLRSAIQKAQATALSTIQAENEKLRAELEQKEKYYEQMVDALAATESAELEQVKAERDMAVEDFRRIGSEGLCSVCGNLNAPDLYCADCKGTAHIVTDMFEWRGQKKD